MSSVKSIRIGDIVNFKRGYDLPASERFAGQYPVISSGGISGFHSDYKKDGEGIITGRYGTLGEVYYVNGKFWPHNTTLYSTNFYENIPRYVFYLMKCLGNLKTSDKSTVPGINRNDLHELIVPYIESKLAQQHIASTLSMLDRKIKLNNKINDNLEQMAKTVYDYWFVQFNFPNSKGEPYKSSGGKMVYNDIVKREIPKDWEVKNLLNISDLFGGGTPSTTKKDYWNGKIPFFTPSDANESIFSINTIQTTTEKGVEESSTKIFEKGTIFLTARGSVGKVMIASKTMAMNQSCYALKSKDGHYIFLYFCTVNAIGYLKAKSSGSIFNAIVSNDIKYTPIIIPDKNLRKQFNQNLSCYFERILNNLEQNQKLASIRDWLLPMLMNGQVTVK